jgi:hypothetical protein
MYKYENESAAPEALTDEQLELASGGVDLNVADPTNPLCPEPRPRPWVGHKG